MTTNDEAPPGRRRIAPRTTEAAPEAGDAAAAAPTVRKAKRALPARVVPVAEAPRYRKAGRASKLDDYRDQLGKVPDAEIAGLTGLTVNAVYVYRVRHGIPMMLKRGQRSVAPAPKAAPVAKAAKTEAPAAPATTAKPAKAAKAEVAPTEAPKPASKGWVWQLEDAQGVVLGMTVGTPQEAGAAIERAGVEAIVIRRLGRLV